MKCFEEIETLELDGVLFHLSLRSVEEGWSSYIEMEHMENDEGVFNIVWGSRYFSLPEEALTAAREEFSLSGLRKWVEWLSV